MHSMRRPRPAFLLCSHMQNMRRPHPAVFLSCVRTCAMHVQDMFCLSVVLVYERDMYRPRSALQLCSYMRDACTGRALPCSCVRTCAMHVQAALCLTAVFAHARCMYGPRSAFQLCSHMRGMRGPRSARRMQGVCCTRMASPLAHENAHVAAVLTGFCHGLRAPFPAASTLAFLSSQPQTVVGPTLVWTSERDRLHGSVAVMCVFVSTNC